jgi:signal transduction histidine kinase
VINVTDNRVGWGVAGRGHGLAGLADRLRCVDGTLTVSSPGSGPTSLTATLPRLRPDAHSPSLVLTSLGGEGR